MIEKLYESMDLHNNCKIESTIFKKYFYENVTMSRIDKDILKDDIDKIILKYSLKEENINVSSYKDKDIEYDEIEIIEVNLLRNKRYKKICELIQKAIPYPLIIVLTIDDKFIINAAYKRVNKNDEEKDTIENYIYSPWISLKNMNKNELLFLKSIDIKNLSFVNMYKLYSSFVEKINILNACKFKGSFKTLEVKDIEHINKLNNEINNVDDEINRLKNEINKEIQFNKRIDMNIKIKKLQVKRNNLINELNL